MKRKSLAFLLALSMILGNAANAVASSSFTSEDSFEGAFADASIEDLYEETQENSEDDPEDDFQDSDSNIPTEEELQKSIKLNYRHYEGEDDFEGLGDGDSISAAYDDILTKSYPSKYINPKLPKLRNQSPFGSCWAHSAIALAEINLMKEGIIASPDLSELHLANFVYDSAVDPLGGTDGDKNALAEGATDNFLEMGGNLDFAMHTLATWQGAADEADAPYPRDENADVVKNGLSKDLAYKDKAHLENFYKDHYWALDENGEKTGEIYINTVKELVTRTGAVSISYDHSYGDVYNEDNNCYYNNGEYWGGGHAVTIVGWDDNFSKDNFTIKPEGDGAWLIRNSWYDYGNYPKWGIEEYSEYGYFWMSYYEATIENEVYAAEFNSEDNYTYNYQYDGTMTGTSSYGSKFANVFTASGNDAEMIKAVSFFTESSNVQYVVKVYTDLKDSGKPESGTLEATVHGQTDYAGYYTVKLPDPVFLQKGDTFSVVIAGEGSDPYFDLEMEMTWQTGNWFDCVASAKKGQSFYCSGGSWRDIASWGRNFRIKAFSDDAAVVDPTGIEFDKSEYDIQLKDEFSPVITVLPSDATNKKYSLESSDENVVKVVNGTKLQGVGLGTATVTAKTSKGGLTATAIVNVTETFKIKYVLNGATNSTANPASYVSGKEFTFENATPPTGYTFEGWYADSAFKTPKSGITKSDCTDITIYAKNEPIEYKIKFDANGGTGTMEYMSIKYDTKAVLSANTYTREGFCFVSWNTKADGSGDTFKDKASVKNLMDKPGTVTLYALWAKEIIPVTSVTFDTSEISLFTNSKTENTWDAASHLIFTGKDGKTPSEKKMEWSSSNDQVATVDPNGKVTAVSTYGETSATAVITATTTDGTAKTASVKVVVSNHIEELRILDTASVPKWYASSSNKTVQLMYGTEGEVLEKGEVKLAVGSSFTVKADILPKSKDAAGVFAEGVLNRNVVWGSDNSAIVLVDDKGKLTAVSSGTTVVFAISEDGGLKASFTVTVCDPVGSVALSESSFKLGVGNRLKLLATVTPFSADQKVVWSVQSGKESIISVDENGVVTGLSKGTAYVIATSSDGKKSAKCSITVGQDYDTVDINTSGNKDIVAAGKSLQLTVSFSKAGSKVTPVNKNIRWEIIEGGDCAYISEKGLLTGVKEGKVKVRATGEVDSNISGGKKIVDEEYIYVYVPVAKAALSDNAITIYTGKTYTPEVNVTPSILGANAKDTATGSEVGTDVKSEIVWALKNPDDSEYVTVDAKKGTITALKDTAKAVAVTATFRPFRAAKDTVLTVKVTVKDKTLSKISLSSSALKMNVGTTNTVSAKLTPSVPLEGDVTWTVTSGEEYISWKANGLKVSVTAKKATPKGTAVKLTATTVGTNAKGKQLSATCSIIIGNEAKFVSLLKGKEEVNGTTKQLLTGKSMTFKAKVYGDKEKTILSGNQKVYYTSSNNAVATVSSTGKVTAVWNGTSPATPTATITAYSADNSKVKATVTINVLKPITKLSLDKTKAGVSLNSKGNVKQYEVIQPVIAPTNASDAFREITWTASVPSKIQWAAISSDKVSAIKSEEEIQRVFAGVTFRNADSEGITTKKGQALAIKGLAAGKVTLTATEPGKKKATCSVTVYTYVTGLELKEASGITKTSKGAYKAELAMKKSVTVKPMVSLYGAPYSDAPKSPQTTAYNSAKKFAPSLSVSYRSSNPNVATVNSSGKITAKGVGTTTIYVTTKDGGLGNTISVTVK